MGWSFEHRDKGEMTNREWVEGQYTSGRYEVLDVATKNMVMYVAIKNTETGLVSAEVILTQWTRSTDYFNFGTKGMSESMGPCEDNCPKRILDKLSPLDDLYGPDVPGEEGGRQWAGAWRARAYARLDRPKLSDGDIVTFNETWLKVKTFVVEKRKRTVLFRPIVDGVPSYTRWRIRGWQDLPFEVVTQ